MAPLQSLKVLSSYLETRGFIPWSHYRWGPLSELLSCWICLSKCFIPFRMVYLSYIIILEANSRSSAIFKYQAFLSFRRLVIVCLLRSLYSSSSDALLSFFCFLSCLWVPLVKARSNLFVVSSLWSRCSVHASLTTLVLVKLKLIHFSLTWLLHPV